ncbi:RagB/SusD family nutrient uptake outer membrane protein [Mucilaginibacter mali]|uniref:RagB/SusD family nutrient uptake outer membrane protein n=1 Tax=Mucilaginibacter mali TaxID=2740462 RepID=A0A7D4UPK3_9SPHI|nr:RagB/SusD family nutrient uptake outer membrane protein [Mucilaginibacter mali]QKJ30660.1 RagB/SusD family nutrient uptake outer membrane protein [Mucilaginibacter mali]
MKKILKYIMLSMVITAPYACKKELGALPQNAKVAENTILDQGTSQIALNGAYYNFANATQIKTGWQSHELYPSEMTGYIVYGLGGNIGIYINDLSGENTNASGYWLQCYKALNAVDNVIKGVNALDDNKFTGTRKKEIIAEAHFLRAYAHFKLLNFYGEWYKPDSKFGVLLRDESSTLTTIAKARNTVKETYDFIISDLDDAIANAPATNQVYYATKWAAMALKMRVLMCRGTAADYTQVITLGNTIIQTGPYTLEAKQEDIFHTKGLASKEIILGIQPQALQTTDNYSKSRQYYPGASALYAASSTLKDLYANDPRLTWMVGTKTTFTDLYAPGTAWFMKYILQGGVASTVSESDYAFRLTEVYLLQAEAIVRSGGSLANARTLVHTIQACAGITATTNNTNYLAVEAALTTDAMNLEIYKETARSMVAEDGQEWNALLRLPFATVKSIRSTITSTNQFIYPVPKDEFQYNPLFGDQNPGYIKY